MKHLIIATLATACIMPGPVHAEGFQITDNCLQILQTANDTDKALLGAWVIGYLDSANQSKSSLVRFDNAMVVLRNLSQACVNNPNASILQVVQASKKNTADAPGTKANAELFLRQFLAADADRVSLTAALRPTEADIRAVYAPELADKLVPMYGSMFTPGAHIGPNEGQTQLLVWRGTTGSLKRGDPVLKDFPGGYGDVRQYLLGEHPIVRFKFVKPGESLGMAFDGLVHVHGRWVLMPKPWRALGN